MIAASAKHLDADFVRNSASGLWLSIFTSLAPEIEIAVVKPGKHIPCPIHGGKDGFKLFKDTNSTGGGICNTCGPSPDGFGLLMWLKDWSFPDTLDAVAGVLGLSASAPKPEKTKPVNQVQPKVVNDKWVSALLRGIWKQSLPLSHDDSETARLYLKGRGLDESLIRHSSLRFHPELEYRDENNVVTGKHPVLLALVEKDGKPVTLHRTYLTSNGRKAAVECPKKIMLSVNNIQLGGSYVRLGNPGRVLYVAEGLETALAVAEATGMATWALISATWMTSFVVPDGVERLVIWADKDRADKQGIEAGLKHATVLAEKVASQGIEVSINLPREDIPSDKKSIDWLDVFNSGNLNAFAVRAYSAFVV